MNAAKDRYLDLIDATLRHALTERPPPATDGPLTMELALPAIACRMGLIRSDDETLGNAVERFAVAPMDARVVDGAAQTRSTYRPLLSRCLTRFAASRPARVFGRVDRSLLERLESFGRGAGPVLTADGADVAAQAFDALLINNRDRNVRVSLRAQLAADAVFGRLFAVQSAEGRFLTSTSDDQLEPAWYHELAVLHAVVTYGRENGDETAQEAAKRSARYHAAEVQPDHASSHPFGLAALLGDPDGIHLADMMLHAAGVQQPAAMDAVSLVLLFDALESSGRAPA